MSNRELLATRAVKKCKEVRGLIAAHAHHAAIMDGMDELEIIAEAVMVKEAMGRATSYERVRLLTRRYEALTDLLGAS